MLDGFFDAFGALALGFADRLHGLQRISDHKRIGWTASSMNFVDFLDDGRVFLIDVAVHLVVVVDTVDGSVGRNLQDVEFVNLIEFVGLG